MPPKTIKVELPEGAQVTYDDGKYTLPLAGVSPDTLLMLAQKGYQYLISNASGNAGAEGVAKLTDEQRAALATRVGYPGDPADAKSLSAHAIQSLRATRVDAIAKGDTSFSAERGSGQTVEGIMRQLAKSMVENAYKAQHGALPAAPAKGKTHPAITALVNQCLEVHKVALRKQAEGQMALLASMAPAAAKAA